MKMEIIKKRVNCITINTDASFNHSKKVGGYAFYIVCDLFKIQKSGKFKTNPVSAEEAEIMCIGNAIATLLAQKELPSCKWLIINNDCKYGMQKIKSSKGKLAISVHKLWQQLIHRLGSCKNKFRYVAAHTDKDDARSKVNEWCDREAKKWMRISANEININHEKETNT